MHKQIKGIPIFMIRKSIKIALIVAISKHALAAPKSSDKHIEVNQYRANRRIYHSLVIK